MEKARLVQKAIDDINARQDRFQSEIDQLESRLSRTPQTARDFERQLPEEPINAMPTYTCTEPTNFHRTYYRKSAKYEDQRRVHQKAIRILPGQNMNRHDVDNLGRWEPKTYLPGPQWLLRNIYVRYEFVEETGETTELDHSYRNWQEFKDRIEQITVDYPGGSMVIVQSITLSYMKASDYQALKSAGFSVRGSHGIPTCIESDTRSFWLMDMMKLNSACAPFAFYVWRQWHDLVPTSKPGVYERRINNHKCVDDLLSDYVTFSKTLTSHKFIRQWCTDDFYLCGGKKSQLVQHFSEDPNYYEELSSIASGDERCHVVIDHSGHASLLLPSDTLSPILLKWLTKKSKSLVLDKIKDKALKSTPLKHINTLDIESFRRKINEDTRVHEPELLCLIREGVKYSFSGADNPMPVLQQFAEFIVGHIAKTQEYYVHNLAYDGTFLKSALRPYLNPDAYEPLKVSRSGTKIFKMVFRLQGDKTLTLRDSYSLLPFSLKKLALDFLGLKIKDFNVAGLRNRSDLWSSECVKYCFSDCEYLQEILVIAQQKTMAKFNANILRYPTAPSFSKFLFYGSPNGYDRSSHPLYQLSPHIDQWLREGYHGARTEVFHRGVINGPLYCRDFNSHYPSIMTMDLPYGKPVQISPNMPSSHPLSQDLNTNNYKWLHNNPGFYDIKILKDPHHRTALFGVKDPKSGRLIFRYLERGECLQAEHSATLLKALELGYNFHILGGLRFDHAPIMKDWTESIYAERIAPGVSSVEKELYKLVLNSAYGSFGMQWENKTVDICYGTQHSTAQHNNDTVGLSSGFVDENNIYTGLGHENLVLEHTNIALASAITSLARLKLFDTIDAYREAGITVYYCDTDSLYTTVSDSDLPPHLQALNHPKLLGALKNETTLEDPSAYIDTAVFVVGKGYAYRTNTGKYVSHLKSVNVSKLNWDYDSNLPLSPEDNPDAKMFSLLCLMADGHIQDIRVNKFMRPSILSWTSTPLLERVYTLQVTGLYHKGIVTSNGSIVPFNRAP